MAKEGESYRATPTDKQDDYKIPNDIYDHIPKLALEYCCPSIIPPTPGPIDPAENWDSDQQDYCYNALPEPEAQFESDGQGEVDYPSDPDELSDNTNPDSPSDSKESSASDEASNTEEQSDYDLAFEVAYEHLLHPEPRRFVNSKQNLPVTDSSEDAGATNVESRESATASNRNECSQSSSTPINEQANADDQHSEEAGSEVQQRTVANRLKTKGDRVRAISTMRSDVSKLESKIAALLSSSKDPLSAISTSEALFFSRITKELKQVKSKLGDGLSPARSSKPSCPAGFAVDLYDGECLPSAKRTIVASWRAQSCKPNPDYRTPAVQFSEKTGVTLRHPGSLKRSITLFGGVWERAKTVDLGQPTQQPVKSLSPQQWPKPVPQPAEPPPWQSFLTSFKRPVQQSVEDPSREAIPQADSEREQQSFEQSGQQLARLTVDDSVTQSTGQQFQQPVHNLLTKSLEDISQQSIGEPVKTPDQSSTKTQPTKPPETPNQQPAENPIKKPQTTLLLEPKPQQEQPSKQPSPNPSPRKPPACRRVERSARLSQDSSGASIPPSASSQPISQHGLAISSITVIYNSPPTAPHISPLSPSQTPPASAPKPKIITLKLPSESPNSAAPEPETALTIALQSLTLISEKEPLLHPSANNCPSKSANSSSPAARSPILTASNSSA